MTTFIKDNQAIILLNDEVTIENSKQVTEFIYGVSFLNEVDEIFVSINSPGGSVMGGFNIFSALVNSEKKVVTRIDGIAASIAAIIFFAGQEREMVDFGLFMIHDPFGGDNKTIEKIKESLMVILGKDNFKNLSELMEDETWLNVDEMIERKLIDTKIEINKGEMKESKITNKAMELFEVANKLISENYKEMKETKNEEALESNLEERVEALENENTEVQSEETETPKAEVESEVEEEVEAKKKDEEIEEKDESIVDGTEEVEAPVAEEEVLEEVLEEVENKIEEVDNFADLKNVIADLKKENDELKNSLSIYKDKEENEAKLELLNNAGVSEESHEKWLKLDIETIKDLAGTVNKKSPGLKVDFKAAEMSVEDKKNLLREDPEEYSRLIREKIIK